MVLSEDGLIAERVRPYYSEDELAQVYSPDLLYRAAGKSRARVNREENERIRKARDKSPFQPGVRVRYTSSHDSTITFDGVIKETGMFHVHTLTLDDGSVYSAHESYLELLP